MIATQREILVAVSCQSDSQAKVVDAAKRWLALEEYRRAMAVKANREARQTTSFCQLWVTFQLVRIESIIRPFKLKEFYLFYYLIDAGELSFSKDIPTLNQHQWLILKEIASSTLIKWYLLPENSYGFASIVHLFLKRRLRKSQIENLLSIYLENTQNDNFWRRWDKIGDL